MTGRRTSRLVSARWGVALLVALSASAGVVATASIGHGAEPAADDTRVVLEAIQARYKDLRSLRATFTQITHDAFGDDKVEAKLTVKPPGRFRFSMGGSPPTSLYVSDGKTMWAYTPADHQVLVYDDVAERSVSGQELLTNLGQLEERFEVVVVSKDASGCVIQLSPKGDDAFKTVTITFDKAWKVQRVVRTDAFDNVVEMVFHTLEINPAVDDAQFTFVPPDASVEVIQGTSSKPAPENATAPQPPAGAPSGGPSPGARVRP